MKNATIENLLWKEWNNWHLTKDTVTYFGFREYIRGEYGIIYIQNRFSKELEYVVCDEKKYAWTLLKA